MSPETVENLKELASVMWTLEEEIAQKQLELKQVSRKIERILTSEQESTEQ